VHGSVAAGAARPGAHADQAQPAPSWTAPSPRPSSWIDRRSPAAGGEFHLHVARRGVARNIGERLLRDAEQMRFGFVGQATE